MKIDINKNIHIVFGFEHYNPLGIVRSLGEAGIRPICIIIKDKRPITSKSKYVSKLKLVFSIKEGYDYLIQTYGGLEEKAFVYTSDDKIANYLDARYDELRDKFYFFNAGQDCRVARYQNKHNIIQLAVKHGLDVLKTYVVDIGEIPDGIEYPVITKAIISTLDNWKEDMIICYNEEELREAYKKIRSPRVLLQKYIKKKNELCLEGVSVSKGTQTLISIASQYNYQLQDSYSPYMTVQSFQNNELKKKLLAMLEEIQFEGIFEIEFLIDQNDKLYFLEINFRNSTWSYASTIAGMPLPIIWSMGMLDNSVIDESYKIINEPFTAMVEFDDYRRRVKTHQISTLHWFKDFKNSKCKYYIGKNDIKPFISVIMCKCKGLLWNGVNKIFSG